MKKINKIEAIKNAKGLVAKQELLNQLTVDDFKAAGQEYLNYHQHTMYSVQDGFQRLDAVVAKVPEGGAVCISDHGTMSGYYKFTKECVNNNKKAIHACEFYIQSLVPTPKNMAQQENEDFDQLLNGEHILLIAENNIGLKNLFHLLAESAKIENFNNRPHITWEKLEEFSEGVLCTTACIGSPVNRPIFNKFYQKNEEDAYAKSRNALIKLIEIFGTDRLYLEIQKHEIVGEEECNENLIALAREFNLKLTCGLDSHYTEASHAPSHTLIKNMSMKTDAAINKLNKQLLILNDCVLEAEGKVTIQEKKHNESVFETINEFDNGYEAVQWFNENCVKGKSQLNALSYKFIFTEDGEEVEEIIQVNFAFEGRYYYQLENDLVKELFGEELMNNTLEIAARCNVVVSDEGYYLPTFTLPEEFAHMSNAEYFMYLSNKGLERIGKSDDVTYKERLQYEYSVIEKMGFLDYFLIVQELVNWAKGEGIWVGPGRGSAAGAMVSYLLGITKLDPIKQELLFERFLNPGRVSMPDIDVDFEKARRHEVIQHLRDVYGEDCVARVVTFGEQKAKTALDDVIRNLHAPTFVNTFIKKLLPDNLNLKLSKIVLDEEGNDSYAPEFVAALKSNNENGGKYTVYGKVKNDETGKFETSEFVIDLQSVYDQALMLENNIRSIGQHACAVGITPTAISNYVPQIITGKNENRDISVGVTGGEIDDLGLLKVDVLGLNNGDIVMNAIKLINKRLETQPHPEYNHLTLEMVEQKMMEDISITELFKSGNTYGLFQVEGAGMTDVLMKFFADTKDMSTETMFLLVSTVLSLYRPGPMGSIPDFIEAMKTPESVEYLHPAFKNTLGKTYGFPVFQEQIMNLAEELSAFSPAEKDYLRKAMGKKDAKLLAELGLKFIDGAVKNGMERDVIQEYWDKTIIPFGEYAFNKSHSDCYTFITLTNAWLKHHYPHEFTAALLNENIDKADKLVGYVAAARKAGIVLNAPDINHSKNMFSVNVTTNELYIGLRALKGVKDSAEQVEYEAFLNGEFESMYDLFIRMSKPEYKFNKKIIEGLILSGAFDEFVEGYDAIEKRSKLMSKIDFFSDTVSSFKTAYKARATLRSKSVHNNKNE